MEYVIRSQRNDNSFKFLITDRFSYWQKELVSVLIYGALYCWIFSFYVLIRQRQTEFPMYLPLSIGLFGMSLWTMNRFQAEVFLKYYPKYYLNKNQWNRDLFDRFLQNRLINFLKKRGWGKEQIQVLRPEVKEMADKIIAHSLLKRTFVKVPIEFLITQFLANTQWPASHTEVIKIGITLSIFGSLFLSFYTFLIQLELSRIQFSNLRMLQDLHKKLGDILLRRKLK